MLHEWCNPSELSLGAALTSMVTPFFHTFFNRFVEISTLETRNKNSKLTTSLR